MSVSNFLFYFFNISFFNFQYFLTLELFLKKGNKLFRSEVKEEGGWFSSPESVTMESHVTTAKRVQPTKRVSSKKKRISTTKSVVTTSREMTTSYEEEEEEEDEVPVSTTAVPIRNQVK